MNASRTASNRAVLAGLLLAGGALLAGCGGGTAAQILGVGQTTPDEFAVAPSAPLAIPATFDSLPVPQPGAPRPQEGPLYLQAQAALFNSGQPAGAGGSETGGAPVVTAAAAARAPTAADTAILARAGGGATDPNVRATIDSEEDTTAQANRSQLDAILGASRAAGGTVLDPQAEAARIRAAQAAGAPLTQGETEILPPKPKGWIESIFDW